MSAVLESCDTATASGEGGFTTGSISILPDPETFIDCSGGVSEAERQGVDSLTAMINGHPLMAKAWAEKEANFERANAEIAARVAEPEAQPRYVGGPWDGPVSAHPPVDEDTDRVTVSGHSGKYVKAGQNFHWWEAAPEWKPVWGLVDEGMVKEGDQIMDGPGRWMTANARTFTGVPVSNYPAVRRRISL